MSFKAWTVDDTTCPFIDPRLFLAFPNPAGPILISPRGPPFIRIPARQPSFGQDLDRLDVEPVNDLILPLLILLR
jgi:hypothetical protein